MNKSEMAAAKQVKICGERLISFWLQTRGSCHTQVTKRPWMNLARGNIGTTSKDMMGIR